MIPEVSAIIPSYNEGERIIVACLKVLEILSRLGCQAEIIPVSDGSTDGSPEDLRALAAEIPQIRPIIYRENRGKGAAVRAGILATRGQKVFFTDADLAAPAEEVPHLLRALDTFPVVIGSRTVPGARILVPQPWQRRLGGYLFRWLVEWAFSLGIADTQCGFKGFRQEAARDIFRRCRVNGFAFDVEILLWARRLGYKIYELPIDWRDGGRSSVRPATAAAMLVDVWRLKLANPAQRAVNKGMIGPGVRAGKDRALSSHKIHKIKVGFVGRKNRIFPGREVAATAGRSDNRAAP